LDFGQLKLLLLRTLLSATELNSAVFEHGWFIRHCMSIFELYGCFTKTKYTFWKGMKALRQWTSSLNLKCYYMAPLKDSNVWIKVGTLFKMYTMVNTTV
jgi:hypothetical protein